MGGVVGSRGSWWFILYSLATRVLVVEVDCESLARSPSWLSFRPFVVDDWNMIQEDLLFVDYDEVKVSSNDVGRHHTNI